MHACIISSQGCALHLTPCHAHCTSHALPARPKHMQDPHAYVCPCLHLPLGLVSRSKASTAANQRRPMTALSAAAGAAGSSSDSPNMGAVLVAVGVACMGAFAFGYHLGVVNGPLEAIAKELGFAGNQALSGLVGRARHWAERGTAP